MNSSPFIFGQYTNGPLLVSQAVVSLYLYTCMVILMIKFIYLKTFSIKFVGLKCEFSINIYESGAVLNYMNQSPETRSGC